MKDTQPHDAAKARKHAQDHQEQVDGGVAAPQKGIAPPLLISQIHNTVPFIFAADFVETPKSPHLTYLRKLNRAAQENPRVLEEMDHLRYFELCLSAHHGTCAGFVPTDVDNFIRFKLWDKRLPAEVLTAMGELVMASHEWDCRPVSSRWVASPIDEPVVTGHLGEWFSTAAAAYAALREVNPELAGAFLEKIEAELVRHAQVFTEYKKRRDGISLLKVATITAHNLGDLDRVIDMWKLPADDELRKRAYKAGHETACKDLKPLKTAGDLNKAMMAAHAHRHFPLRDPRPLRRAHALLLPVSPFLDDWGKTLVTSRALAPEEVGEVAVALIHGYDRVVDFGYARALHGLLEVFPGGASGLGAYLPSKAEKALRSGKLHDLIKLTRERFEEPLAKKALAFQSGS